jgi:hypothetical protein
MRDFLSHLAECGIVKDACLAVGMSARAAYNLRDRDPLFAAGWEAASAMARPRLADEAYARAVNGMVDRIYKDGFLVAERHRYDNRLTMSVLARLDARVDRAEERGDPHLLLAARWEDYLLALGEGRRADGLALLAPPVAGGVGEGAQPPAAADLRTDAGGRELRELQGEGAVDDTRPALDHHSVWEEDDGWWTDYPPPPGFGEEEDAEEEGAWGEEDYRRRLSLAEQAVIDADCAAEDAVLRAVAEAQRDACFGFTPSSGSE